MVVKREFRVGSPITVRGTVTTIERLPRNENDPFGFKVAESPDGVQLDEIEPIELTERILTYFGFKYSSGSWIFDANNHKVEVGKDFWCSIDREIVGKIEYLHELKNFLYDNCDEFVLKRFQLIDTQTNDSGSVSNDSY